MLDISNPSYGHMQGWRKMISFGGAHAKKIVDRRVAMARGRVQEYEWDVPPPVRSAEAIVSNTH